MLAQQCPRILLIISRARPLNSSAPPAAVKATLGGINSTIIAYGQTGSGKTYSIVGTEAEPGIAPRVADAIFAAIMNAPDTHEFTIRVSALEVYMERVRDLMKPRGASAGSSVLLLRQDPLRGVFADGATEQYVASADEMKALMRVAESGRRVASTDMNDASSRSHGMLCIQLTVRDTVGGGVQTSKLHLVDLAGSECVGKTGAEGVTLDEAKVINRSLFTLAKVVHALSEGGAAKGGASGSGDGEGREDDEALTVDNNHNNAAIGAAAEGDALGGRTTARQAAPSQRTKGLPPPPQQQPLQHIPYRDSKLTRLLQDSLGGNARTAILVCCSPCISHAAETLSTLRFAMRAKAMPNAPVVNSVRSVDQLSRLLIKAERAIDAQASMITALQEQLSAGALLWHRAGTSPGIADIAAVVEASSTSSSSVTAAGATAAPPHAALSASAAVASSPADASFLLVELAVLREEALQAAAQHSALLVDADSRDEEIRNVTALLMAREEELRELRRKSREELDGLRAAVAARSANSTISQLELRTFTCASCCSHPLGAVSNAADVCAAHEQLCRTLGDTRVEAQRLQAEIDAARSSVRHRDRAPSNTSAATAAVGAADNTASWTGTHSPEGDAATPPLPDTSSSAVVALPPEQRRYSYSTAGWVTQRNLLGKGAASGEDGAGGSGGGGAVGSSGSGGEVGGAARRSSLIPRYAKVSRQNSTRRGSSEWVGGAVVPATTATTMTAAAATTHPVIRRPRPSPVPSSPVPTFTPMSDPPELVPPPQLSTHAAPAGAAHAAAAAAPTSTTTSSASAAVCAPQHEDEDEDTAAAAAVELQQRLTALMYAHRQLLRKFALVDAEADVLQAEVRTRDDRIAVLADALVKQDAALQDLLKQQLHREWAEENEQQNDEQLLLLQQSTGGSSHIVRPIRGHGARLAASAAESSSGAWTSRSAPAESWDAAASVGVSGGGGVSVGGGVSIGGGSSSSPWVGCSSSPPWTQLSAATESGSGSGSSRVLMRAAGTPAHFRAPEDEARSGDALASTPPQQQPLGVTQPGCEAFAEPAFLTPLVGLSSASSSTAPGSTFTTAAATATGSTFTTAAAASINHPNGYGSAGGSLGAVASHPGSSGDSVDGELMAMSITNFGGNTRVVTAQ